MINISFTFVLSKYNKSKQRVCEMQEKFIIQQIIRTIWKI